MICSNTAYVERALRFDGRWVKLRRPRIKSGIRPGNVREIRYDVYMCASKAESGSD
jgi:hypothetical protein